MAKDSDDKDDGNREARISEIKQKLQEIAGGKMVAWEGDPLRGEQREKFWREVLTFENGPFTTDFDRLVKAGVELPEPSSLDDERLTAKLWEVIGGLARMRVFLTSTDHLSDRELYSCLWHEALREEVPESEEDSPSSWSTIDLVSTGGDGNTCFYLKHYADEKTRQNWRAKFPDDVIPPHEDPPYDRDRHLPQP